MGWMEGRSYDDAMKILDAITFEDVPAPVVNIAAAKSRKVSKPTPLVNADVEEGEELVSPPSDATGTVGDI